MTKPMMDLRALVEKSGDADLLREMIGFAAERLMELEVGAKTGADYGEKSSARLAQRNHCPAGASEGCCREGATAIGTGRPGPAASSCASRACAPAPIFPRFSSRGARLRRR